MLAFNNYFFSSLVFKIFGKFTLKCNHKRSKRSWINYDVEEVINLSVPILNGEVVFVTCWFPEVARMDCFTPDMIFSQALHRRQF